MKILLVSSNSGSRGGGEIYLHNLAAGLSGLRHSVHGLFSADPRMDQIAASLRPYGEVSRLELTGTYQRWTRSLGSALDVSQQWLLARFFRARSPDIIHVNQQVAEDGLDLLLAARRSGIPFLSTIHITHSAKSLGARAGKIRDLVTGIVLKRADTTYITVGESPKRELTSRFAFLNNANRVQVVFNGVSFAAHDSPTRGAARQRWKASPTDVVLGCVGRLEAQKAPNFALELVARLRQKGLPVRLVWIGEGGMRVSFEQQSRRLGIEEVVMLDGWRDDVSSCLQGFDIFLMPSKFEGMPLALLEAMGAGLCCCVSAVDGMTEAMEQGISGFFCRAGDLAEWGTRLELLVVDAGLREAVGKRAEEIARRRFSIERMAGDTVNVYEKVLRAHPAGPQARA